MIDRNMKLLLRISEKIHLVMILLFVLFFQTNLNGQSKYIELQQFKDFNKIAFTVDTFLIINYGNCQNCLEIKKDGSFFRRLSNFDIDTESSFYFEFGTEIYKYDKVGNQIWRINIKGISNEYALDLKYYNKYLYIYCNNRLYSFNPENGHVINSINLKKHFIELNSAKPT